MSKFKIYAKSILIPLILGGIVGFIMSKFMDYDSLQKPLLSPPGMLFPIVWSVLYILMGISYGILKSNNLLSTKITLIYYLQLFVNLLWPIIFFVFKLRLLAFIWLILLAVLIISMIVTFYNKNKISGLLQIPYLLWVLFAGYLNLFMYLLN